MTQQNTPKRPQTVAEWNEWSQALCDRKSPPEWIKLVNDVTDKLPEVGGNVKSRLYSMLLGYQWDKDHPKTTKDCWFSALFNERTETKIQTLTTALKKTLNGAQTPQASTINPSVLVKNLRQAHDAVGQHRKWYGYPLSFFNSAGGLDQLLWIEDIVETGYQLVRRETVPFKI